MPQGKKQVKALCGTAGVWDQASKERFTEITSGSRWEKLGRGGTDDELAKPLDPAWRVQIPSDQSRADRSVARVAIHRVTGGCEAYTARKQAVRASTEILSCSDADVFEEAEGSIRQQPLCEVVLESAVSLAQGMFPKRLAGNPRELPILSHTRRNAFGLGREKLATKGRPKEARIDG
jgi:hypothetical protein